MESEQARSTFRRTREKKNVEEKGVRRKKESKQLMGSLLDFAP
jgi:hypothetical protein